MSTKPPKKDIMAFTEDDLKSFKREYKRAVRLGHTTFHWRGADWRTDFSNYVIEFLEAAFKERP